MIIVLNNNPKHVLHIVDRLESEDDLKNLVKWFPYGIVCRKSNNSYTLLADVKLRNFHWYK